MAHNAQSPEAWLESTIGDICSAQGLRVIADGWSRKTFHIHVDEGPRSAGQEVARLESGFFQDPIIFITTDQGAAFVAALEEQLNTSNFDVEIATKPLVV